MRLSLHGTVARARPEFTAYKWPLSNLWCVCGECNLGKITYQSRKKGTNKGRKVFRRGEVKNGNNKVSTCFFIFLFSKVSSLIDRSSPSATLLKSRPQNKQTPLFRTPRLSPAIFLSRGSLIAKNVGGQCLFVSVCSGDDGEHIREQSDRADTDHDRNSGK